MVGKILPYVVIGYIQLTVIMSAAFIIFDVPMMGSLRCIVKLDRHFHHGELSRGFTFSTIKAKNQLQAMQMTFFFFLPSILLSGFMFPFRAMPGWAQNIGEVLPLTYFLRIVRGILLKGNEVKPAPANAGNLWPMLAFLFVAGFIALKTLSSNLRLTSHNLPNKTRMFNIKHTPTDWVLPLFKHYPFRTCEWTPKSPEQFLLSTAKFKSSGLQRDPELAYQKQIPQHPWREKHKDKPAF